jgi:crotonobetainyl-CoA:carnitine CoA-transferase CaiB-like acyl-CoA transferase
VEQWLQELADGQVPAAKVNNFAEALSNPQILHREMVVEQEHPVSGKYKSAGNPIKMSETEHETFAPAPTLGQHNREVLMGLLDYSEDEVAALEKERAI